ncbi:MULTISPECIES: hypothetical protein [Streptomyces]|uniref:Uncharacterized protein n=1 Tax=Streptomyces ramulosus TaxID=47762 RepID=A0ABW1FSK2_9ACTN
MNSQENARAVSAAKGVDEAVQQHGVPVEGGEAAIDGAVRPGLAG